MIDAKMYTSRDLFPLMNSVENRGHWTLGQNNFFRTHGRGADGGGEINPCIRAETIGNAGLERTFRKLYGQKGSCNTSKTMAYIQIESKPLILYGTGVYFAPSSL